MSRLNRRLFLSTAALPALAALPASMDVAIAADLRACGFDVVRVFTCDGKKRVLWRPRNTDQLTEGTQRWNAVGDVMRRHWVSELQWRQVMS